MKRFLLVLVVLAVGVNFAFAGDGVTPMSASGDKAFMFTFGGLSNLQAENYQGGVGFKYFMSDDMGLRVGLGFGTSTVTEKYPFPVNPGPDKDSSTTSFSIAPGIQYNIAKSGPVAAYVGGQISFEMVTREVKNPNHVANESDEVSSTVFGAALLAGVEWFPWSNISLAAEYQLGFSTESGERKFTSGGQTTTVDAPSVTRIGLGSASSANLTISVYW